MDDSKADTATTDAAATDVAANDTPPAAKPKEYGGPKGLEPTRYGDWERQGICTDF